MNQHEIIAERERLADAVVDAEMTLIMAQTELHNLQAKCKHPNRTLTSHMGETCNHCYDCGYCP